MKISVVTVCYNNKTGLQLTIESVINQTYEDLEYIIIDGDSTDGSVELISEYQKKFSITLVSEPDHGIYDAMNKGIKLSTGEWLNFMNSGDTFYELDTLEEAAKSLADTEDIVYGNTEIIYPDFKTIKNEPEPAQLWQGRIPHQSSFIKASTIKKYGYNSANRIVADLELFMTIYYNGGHLKKINQVIASFAKDGVTEKKGRQVITDAYRTVKKYKTGVNIDIYYNLLKIKPLLKRFLPRNLFKYIKTKTKL